MSKVQKLLSKHIEQWSRVGYTDVLIYSVIYILTEAFLHRAMRHFEGSDVPTCEAVLL